MSEQHTYRVVVTLTTDREIDVLALEEQVDHLIDTVDIPALRDAEFESHVDATELVP